MTLTINIEAAKDRNLSDVMNVVAESFVDPIDRDTMRSYINHQSRRLVLAYDSDRRVVGYMAYTHAKRTIYLDNIAVIGVNRRMHVGAQLIGFLIGSLNHYKKKNIRAYVPEVNIHAQLFLQDCGFFTTPPYIARKHFQDGQDAYVFEFAPAVLAEEPAKKGSSAR